MPYNQQMRALDQQPSLAKLAEMLQSTRSAGNQYSVPNWVPLLGGSGVGDMFLGKSPEEIENWSYGNAPMQVPEMSRVPQFKKGRAQSLADTAMLLSGPAESTARNAAAGNVGMIIKPKGGNWLGVDRRHSPEYGVPKVVDQPVNSWLEQKLASYIKNEMGTLEDPIRRIADEWPAKQEKLLAAQLNKRDKLKDLIVKYEVEPVPAGVDNPDAWRAARLRSSQRDLEDINNEIGRINEYNPLHYSPENINTFEAGGVGNRRLAEGYPAEGISKSDLAKRWEHYSDKTIDANTVGDFTTYKPDIVSENPWLNKLEPETPLYSVDPRGIRNDLGFEKIADQLVNATRSDTDLPEELRIPVEKLNRISVPQAVEHTAKINDYIAQQEAMENLKRSRNEAVVDYKHYPDKGLSWVEIKNPNKVLKDSYDLPEDAHESVYELARRRARSEGLNPESDDFRFRVEELVPEIGSRWYNADVVGKALKYEGDTMNHCVGGYCDYLLDNTSRIFSLRNSKGEPHVTIETRPQPESDYYHKLMNDLSNDESAKLTVDAYDYNAKNPHLSYNESVIGLMKDRYGPPKEKLAQVYGKNDAPPSEKYLPMVHDFMRTHPEIGDVRNVERGLSHVNAYDLNTPDWDVYNPSHVKLSELGFTPGSDKFNEAKKRFGDWASSEELKSLLTDQGFADGGLVGTPPIMYDPMKVDDIVASIDALHNYAEGGSVDKDSLQLNKPQRTPSHPDKSHIVKTMVGGKEKIIRFGEQGAETAGKPKEGESDRMTAKRASFKARHAKNIAKGPSSAAYWADKVKWAEGGSVSMGDLPFNDPDQLRLYHQAMKHFDDVMENTGGSKKIGKTEARINYNTTTKGDRDRDKDLHTLIADYGIDVGKDAKINATLIKPMEAEGVYLGNLSGSLPVGQGRASLGLQGLHTKYSDDLSGYTAGYTGKVGDGDLSASYFEPADHKSEGRQVQLEYNMPFSKGGSVTSEQENLYHRAMAHYDDLMAA
jgi:hypothetical protein